MKDLKISSILLLGLMIFSVFGCEKEEIIKENELPSSIKSYLDTHFTSCNTTKIIKDEESNELSYDITLDCGVNIEFNGNNQVIDIDGTSQLPNSVIPSNILDYTSTNYSNDFIIGWELEGNNQRVEMNTNVVLEFDSNGDFLRIVD
ncbi:putative PepSY-like beta-lactamase-inhibitor [Balneicella halophila]|uniref:Putative PepSY-like beta-lactamase-inhibitor n=1 Tax=Balneicella halophila TaxID=1537566 RepID=A0A7L4UMI4_BALHA|nr:PepSY-like domain-containing protein [Balneicella halophila]PVX49295.1 putative PepSY-like beta-lactamase-inhibitor [Balneicella halophila]